MLYVFREPAGACCLNIGGQGYSLLKHIQACRWLFINYRWTGGGSNRETETDTEGDRETEREVS